MKFPIGCVVDMVNVFDRYHNEGDLGTVVEYRASSNDYRVVVHDLTKQSWCADDGTRCWWCHEAELVLHSGETAGGNALYCDPL